MSVSLSRPVGPLPGSERSFMSRFAFRKRTSCILAIKLHTPGPKGDTNMTRLFGVAIAIGILAGTIQSNADEAVSITVRPAVTSYGGNAQLRVIVARDDLNRALVWEVDGPNYYRSSETQLNGASAPRSYVFMVRDLPGGEFVVRAILKRGDSSTVVDRSSITVVGGPE